MSEILYPRNPVLIVDDEYYILLNLSGILKSTGMNNIITCQESGRNLALMNSSM